MKRLSVIVILILVVSIGLTAMSSAKINMQIADAQLPSNPQCPKGAEFVQGKCISTEVTEPEIICTQGEYNEKSGQCEIITDPELICPEGSELNKANECIDILTGQQVEGPKPSCDQGQYDTEREICVLITEPTLYCSHGILNENLQCEIPVISTPGLSGQTTVFCYIGQDEENPTSEICFSTIQQCNQEQTRDKSATTGCYPLIKRLLTD